MGILLITSPVTDWEAYTPNDAYPGISGDDLTINFQGSLPRVSVAGETTLWEKVSA